ncbi:IS66 family transposase [Pseudomonas sp. A-RE-19]|uniref:IS66 family transposase n=1 Tax=Pseudomonas sp. A-RE-19 TaxID=2832401 RepID=UPI00398930E1
MEVLKEPDREPGNQSWMWVQAGGPSDRPMILFDYFTSRAQEVATRLLDGYAATITPCTALDAQAGVERLRCWAPHGVSSSKRKKCNPKGKTGRADIALNLINKLYGIERDLKDSCDEDRKADRCRKNWLFSDTPKGQRPALNFTPWSTR